MKSWCYRYLTGGLDLATMSSKLPFIMIKRNGFLVNLLNALHEDPRTCKINIIGPSRDLETLLCGLLSVVFVELNLRLEILYYYKFKKWFGPRTEKVELNAVATTASEDA